MLHGCVDSPQDRCDDPVMLYATNGRVQDLPANTTFEFWNNADYERALKICKIQWQHKFGKTSSELEKTYQSLDFYSQGVMRCALTDPCKTFTSRPAGQKQDWVQWARFCKWLASMSIFDMTTATNDMARSCAIWLGPFLGSNTYAISENCFQSNEQVDGIRFYSMEPWNESICMTRPYNPNLPPPTLPPTDTNWVDELLGWLPEHNKGFASPMTKSELSAALSNRDRPMGYEQAVATAPTESPSWVTPTILVLLGLGIAGTFVAISKRWI